MAIEKDKASDGKLKEVPEGLGFEEAVKKLEECVNKIRSGELSLDESLNVYNKSIMYYNFCSEYLKNAKQKIEIYRPETGKIESFEAGK